MTRNGWTRIASAFFALLLCFAVVPQATAAGYAAGPFGVELFVRGSFNGWGLGAHMKFDAVENEYVGYAEMTPGQFEFKIASADWATVDLGYDEHTADGIVVVGVPEPIETAGYHNLSLTVPEAGVYSFKLNVADLEHMTVRVDYARAGGDGADQYLYSYQGVPFFYDCLGAANPVVADYTVQGTLHIRQNPAGDRIYHDNQRIDGVGYDQLGREYRLHATAPNVYNGKPNTSFTFSTGWKETFVPQDGGPNLYFRYLYKLTIGPNGEVTREFSFLDTGCRP